MTKHDEAVEARKALVRGVLNWAWDAADTNEDRDWITGAMNAFGELTGSLSTARGEEDELGRLKIALGRLADDQLGGVGTMRRYAHRVLLGDDPQMQSIPLLDEVTSPRVPLPPAPGEHAVLIAEAIERVRERERNLTEWLRDNAPFCVTDQKHLDADTPERAYWHYGYMVALRDVLKRLDALEGKPQ
jgi:hypothetical protein